MSMIKWSDTLILSCFVFLAFTCIDLASTADTDKDKLICDFETDFCQWNNMFSSWIRDKYKYEHPLTGPQRAGGQSGSYYIYVPPSNNSSDVAYLQSPLVDLGSNHNGKTCFRFWYYMFGAHVKNLTIEKGNKVVFHQYGDKSAGWICGIFDVTGFSGKITINVYRTGISSSQPYSVIAVDNVEIILSAECKQESCDATIPVSTDASTSSLTSKTSTNPSIQTSVGYISDQPDQPAVLGTLPIAIGVPCGVLLIGAVVVSICIYKRRQSKDIESESLHSRESNVYTGRPDPRHSGDEYDEIYTELNENEMLEMNNISADTDQQTYDEIDDVKRPNKVEYVNQSEERVQSQEYLEAVNNNGIPNGSARPKSEDYLKPENHLDGRPKSEDYLRPQHHTNARPDSEDYLKPEVSKNEKLESEDYLTPEFDENGNSDSEDYLRPKNHKNVRPDSEDYLKPEVSANKRPESEDYLAPAVHENDNSDSEDYLRLQVHQQGRPESHDYLKPEVPPFIKPSNNDYIRVIRQSGDMIDSPETKGTEW